MVYINCQTAEREETKEEIIKPEPNIIITPLDATAGNIVLFKLTRHINGIEDSTCQSVKKKQRIGAIVSAGRDFRTNYILIDIRSIETKKQILESFSIII